MKVLGPKFEVFDEQFEQFDQTDPTSYTLWKTLNETCWTKLNILINQNKPAFIWNINSHSCTCLYLKTNQGGKFLKSKFVVMNKPFRVSTGIFPSSKENRPLLCFCALALINHCSDYLLHNQRIIHFEGLKWFTHRNVRKPWEATIIRLVNACFQ